MLSPQTAQVAHGGLGTRLKRGYSKMDDTNQASVLAFFQQRIQTMQSQRETSDSLIKDLMLYCEHIESTLRNENALLTKEVEETRLDLADSTKSRRDLQKQIERCEQELTKVRSEHTASISRNPYVTVLIDGDGLIFNESYIKQGIEGGKKAAKALRNAVAEQCHQHAHEIEVSAKIVANLSGLARALARDGATDSLTDLKDFTLGFTQAKASFDFIDVGYGKERADSKIRENTRWHLENQNCKQIVLGISHDSGYAPFLDEILRDESTKRRITILEGVPTVKDLVTTGVQILRLDNDLFRSDKLGERTVTQERTSPTESSPKATNGSHSTPPASSTASPFSSYAGMAVKSRPASPPPTLTVPLAPRSVNAGTRQKAAAQPKWNPGPRGFDKTITVNPAVLDAVKKRKDNSKLCNNHFLRGPCAKGDSCQFVHKYKPTEDELAAILYLSRMNPCTMGQDCDADDCIYGHHCPSMRDNTCVHPYCKFPEDAHPPGTKYKNAHIDKNY